MAFELLSEPIRKYIRDKRWDSLRPIQAAAITKILSTQDNYILASRTASGKTEAAFLPILSKVDFSTPGVKVLYVSPLIALINDQFVRVEELCKYMDVEVTKWHGEANKSLKSKLIREPKGIVLITPESLEAMFVNAPYNVKGLFNDLRFVVIDEIHSFIGTDRGMHLKSLLSRLQAVCNNKFNVVGLSATIGDYNEAKKLTGDEANTKVLLDRTSKEMETTFKYFPSEGSELSLDLIKDLYLNTKDNKVLIFPNSRGRAEEIAVKLRKLAEKVNGHRFYFSHHSSVDRELREYVESFAKNNQRQNFCISCTSTLELGIDIGSVDKVVQVDATFSIASLIQRVGRSGRREGEKSELLLYSTNKWSLLQSLACWLLYKEGFIEPVLASEKPYDVLLHQLLSTVKELSGCNRTTLLQHMKVNKAFALIDQSEVLEIVEELIKKKLLEEIEGELIIGLEGERVVNSKDFYSMFKTEPYLSVVNKGNKIGEIPLSLQVRVDENILLAARIWKIVDIDFKASKIEVAPAKDGKKPLFFGSGGVIHPRIRERMLQILIGTEEYSEMDDDCKEVLRELRSEFSNFAIENLENDRPVIERDGKLTWYTFHGTKVNRSLDFMLKTIGIVGTLNEQSTEFDLPIALRMMGQMKAELVGVADEIDWHLDKAILANPRIMDFSKWGRHLPLNFQKAILKNGYFDFEVANHFISELNFVFNDA